MFYSRHIYCQKPEAPRGCVTHPVPYRLGPATFEIFVPGASDGVCAWCEAIYHLPVTFDDLMAEGDRLSAEHDALQRAQADLQERPDDIDGHEAHRIRLLMHADALRAHIQQWREYARKP